MEIGIFDDASHPLHGAPKLASEHPMTSPQFLIPQNQYLSSPYIAWTKQTEGLHHRVQTHLLFTMARYALYHGLKAIGVVPCDEVLVPAYICAAAVEAIEACGAVPVFFRIKRDCSMDLEDVQHRISSRSRAILVVHYFGFPQDLGPVRELANQQRLFLIEDCAHVFNGQVDNTPLGSTGDFSVFSWRKFIPVLDGAELRFNSGKPVGLPELRREPLLFDLKALKYLMDMRLANGKHTVGRAVLKFPARFGRSLRKILWKPNDEHSQGILNMEASNSSFNLNLADSAISRVSEYVLTHSAVQAIVAKRKSNYQGLAERLARIPGVLPLFPALPEGNCPLYLPVFCHNTAGAHRQLRGLGIPATAWDGVRPQAVSDSSFPDAAFLYQNLVFLPVLQNLLDRDLDLIADAVRTVCSRASGATVAPVQPASQEPHLETEGARQSLAGTSAVLPEKNIVGKKKVLMVAYHFPPQMGSSGILRTLKNSRYLPYHGWVPTVLTAHPRAYDRVDKSQLSEIPAQAKVIRAFALDTQKHLSLRGRYFRHTALPDRWVTWALGAVPAGTFQIYKNKIDVILTTFPIASAVLIGYLLHRITGVPWVADFRDSMTEANYPRDPHIRRVYSWLEQKAVRHAARLIFTAESTRRMYLQRYPKLSPEKCLVISNGYDEEDFADLPQPGSRQLDAPLRIQHSGLIYPQERDPLPFFRALSRLKKELRIQAARLSVALRACGNEERYKEIVAQLEIDDIVHFLPALPYRQALEDSNQSDILLLLQGASCDHQIPAKAYEYLRLQKPILALTSRSGDTAGLLNECGGSTLMDIADEEAIFRALPDFLSAVQSSTHPLPSMERVARYSRRRQTEALAACLSAVLTG